MAAAAGALLMAALYALTPRAARTPLDRELNGTIARTQSQLRFGLGERAPRERASLAGRVSDGASAVAGALVCAACVACEATRAPTAPCTRSDARGAYAFDDLAPAGYFIAASAPGFAPASAQRGEPVYADAGQALFGVDIALTRGGARVHGDVVDATGGPIAHAHVRALRLTAPRLSLDVETDAHGRFELWVEPGFIELSAEAEGYARASQRATAPTEVELRLVPGSSIAGVVLRASTGQPLPAVDVRAAPPDNPQLAMAKGALSDADGSFVIEGLEPGAYLLRAQAERTLGAPAQTIELGIAEQRRGVVVMVSDAAEITGSVALAGEQVPCRQGFVALGAHSPLQPAPSAQELAHWKTTPEELARALGPEQVAEIQADGSVRFPAVPPGVYFVNVQCAGQLSADGPRLLRVEKSPIANLKWTVAKGAALEITVVDERGQPQPEAEVILEHPSTASQVISAHETDARGRCVIDGLAAGAYRARAGAQPQQSVSFELTAGRRSEAKLELAGSALLQVELRDDRGGPLDGISVHAVALGEAGTSALRHRALPLGEGRYRIGPLAPGRYAIDAADGVNPPLLPERTPGAIVSLTAGERAHTRIIIARSASITGRVVDAAQAPLSDIWVSAKPQLGPGARALHSAALAEARPQRVLSDADGRFMIERLVPGERYDVRALAPYGSAAVLRGVTPGTPVAITLPEPAAIAGTALDESDRPITALQVSALSRDADSRQTRTFSDAQGRFALPRVAPGAVELTFVSADGKRADVSLQLAAGQRSMALRVRLEHEVLAERADPEP